MTPLALAAHRLASTGHPIFPCQEGGKLPAVERGFHAATTDLAQVAAWWRENPNYNIGMVPARIGWGVIDIDPGGEAEWEALCDGRDCPKDTYIVRTPRGGLHLYYQGDIPQSQHRLGTHIDTRGIRAADGEPAGYTLMPPSVTADGAYRVATQCDVAEAPAWLAPLLMPKVTAVKAATVELDTAGAIQRAETRIRQLIAAGDVAIEGQGGNARTYELFCELRNLGLSVERSIDAIEPWNDACLPPWDHDDLVTLATNAANYSQNEPGAFNVPAAAEVFKDIAVVGAATPAPVRKSRFMRVADMANVKPPEWLVPTLLPLGGTVLLVGGWRSYKTFLTLDLALGVATGLPTLGIQPARKGLVFYCALEGISGLALGRRRAWCKAQDLPEDAPIDNFRLGPAPRLANAEDVTAFLQDLRDDAGSEPIALIVLDTVSQIMAGLDEIREAGRYIQFAHELAQATGATVISVHHTGHDKAKGARGGTIYPANMDTYIEVEATGKLQATLRVVKQKDAPEPPPLFLAGALVGPSLVFKRTADLVPDVIQDETKHEPMQVGAALLALNAIGFEKSVTTHILATFLHAQQPGELPEAYEIRTSYNVRRLRSAARTSLKAYYYQGVWFMPAPTDQLQPPGQ